MLSVLNQTTVGLRRNRIALFAKTGGAKLHASRAPRHVTTTEATATNYGASDWTNYKETLTTYNIKGGQLGNGGNTNTQLEYASRDIAQYPGCTTGLGQDRFGIALITLSVRYPHTSPLLPLAVNAAQARFWG